MMAPTSTPSLSAEPPQQAPTHISETLAGGPSATAGSRAGPCGSESREVASPVLSAEQEAVLASVLQSKNVFFTGRPHRCIQMSRDLHAVGGWRRMPARMHPPTTCLPAHAPPPPTRAFPARPVPQIALLPAAATSVRRRRWHGQVLPAQPHHRRPAGALWGLLPLGSCDHCSNRHRCHPQCARWGLRGWGLRGPQGGPPSALWCVG